MAGNERFDDSIGRWLEDRIIPKRFGSVIPNSFIFIHERLGEGWNGHFCFRTDCSERSGGSPSDSPILVLE